MSYAATLARFGAYLRDPEVGAPEVAAPVARASVYARLVYFNLESSFESNFPVAAQILGATAVNELVRDYLKRYRSQTPLFTELPTQFIDFVEQCTPSAATRWPFLAELMAYEWLEVALGRDPASVPTSTTGSLLRLSPLARLALYRYPVHQLRSDYAPLEPPVQPTTLLVWRNRAHRVRFQALAPLAAAAASLIVDEALSRGALLAALSELAPGLDAELIARELDGLIARWLADDIVIHCEVA